MIPAVMPTYARFDLTFDYGKGVYLYTADGRRYLDFGAGIAVASLGHCHPHLVNALKQQAEKFWHCSNLYAIGGQEKLAERLVANSFANAVFFNNSGGEAVEATIKMARRYQHMNGHPEKFRMISIEGAFHGRSLACIAAGGQEKHLAGFGPKVDGFDQVAYGNLNEMRAAITPATAGIIVEPVQGEGGIRPMPDGYLKALRTIADEFDLVLIYDEVQSGVGRTGKLFAYELTGAQPDVMALAKGLGGGFPMGAVLASEKVSKHMTPGTHGTTFGGNPLAMAVGNAVLDVILADGFLTHVETMAEMLWSALDTVVTAYPRIFSDIRGAGLMIGIKCCGDDGENIKFVKKLMNNGLLTVPAGDNVVRMVPPLIIEQSHIDEAIGIIVKTCQDMD